MLLIYSDRVAVYCFYWTSGNTAEIDFITRLCLKNDLLNIKHIFVDVSQQDYKVFIWCVRNDIKLRMLSKIKIVAQNKNYFIILEHIIIYCKK